MPFAHTESWEPVGFAQFESLSSAITLGTATPTAGTAYANLADGFGTKIIPNHAIISVETQSVRVRDDGTNPTASVGELIAAGSKEAIESSPGAIVKLRIIETTPSAKVTVRYYV